MTRDARRLAALQQAMVRLCVDPGFVDAVYAGKARGLPAEDQALLARVDRRAWSVDGFRRARLVQALIDELPVTAAVLGVPAIDAWLSGPGFVRCLRERGVMAVEAARDLGAAGGDLARLEGAVARARARVRPRGPGIGAAPGVVGLEVQAGVLEAWVRLRAELGAAPTEAVIGGKRLAKPVIAGAGREWLLVEAGADGEVGVSPASAGLVGLVRGAGDGVGEGVLRGLAVRLGAEVHEVGEVVEGLVGEGLLVRVGGAGER